MAPEGKLIQVTKMTKPGFTLTAAPGRPKGSKTTPRPQNVAEFVQLAFTHPLEPPPPAPKPKRIRGGNGIWASFKSPGERQAYARYLASKRDPKNMARTKRRTGTPNGWTAEAAKAAKAKAELEAARLVEKLRAEGTIAKRDSETAAATKAALALIRSPGAPKQRRLMAERLLAHYHPERASEAQR